MKSASEQLSDLTVLTQHENEKYVKYLAALLMLKFDALLLKVKKLIKAEYDPEQTSKAAEVALKKKILSVTDSGLLAIKATLDKEMEGFVGKSTKLYQDQLKAVMDPVKEHITVDDVDLAKVIKSYNKDNVNFEKGKTFTITALWTTFAARLNTIMKQATEQAYDIDENQADYVGSLFGITGGTNVSRSHLQAMVATLIAHGYNSSLKSVNRNNTQFMSGYEWQSVMDSATSDICVHLDGLYYIYGNPDKSTLPYQIVPPAHYRCRSGTVGITKSYSDLGIDPLELEDNQKALLSGEIPEKVSYSQFIKGLPANVQKEVLGATRYDMYIKGEITLDKFYSKDGTKLSLSALEKKGYEISKQYLQYVRSI